MDGSEVTIDPLNVRSLLLLGTRGPGEGKFSTLG